MDTHPSKPGEITESTTESFSRLGDAWRRYRDANSRHDWVCNSGSALGQKICQKVLAEEVVPSPAEWKVQLRPFLSPLDSPAVGREWIYGVSAERGPYFCIRGAADPWREKELRQVAYNFRNGLITRAASCGAASTDPTPLTGTEGGEVAVTYWVQDAFPVKVPSKPEVVGGDDDDPIGSEIIIETLRWSLYAGAYSGASLAQLSGRVKPLLDEDKLYTLKLSERNALRREIQDELKAAGWPYIDRAVRATMIMARYQVCQFVGRC